jgi:hypothetical protein
MPGIKRIYSAPRRFSSDSLKESDKMSANTTEFEQACDENDVSDNSLGLLFDCLEVLYREKNPNFDIKMGFEVKVKNKLLTIAEAFNENLSEEELESLNLKAESEIIIALIEFLGQYLKSNDDPRIAMIIETISIKNKSIIDFFVQKNDKLGEYPSKIRFLQMQNRELTKENKSIQLRLRMITNREANNLKTRSPSQNLKETQNVLEMGNGNLSYQQRVRLRGKQSELNDKMENDNTTKLDFMQNLASIKGDNTKMILPSQLKSIIKDLVISKIKKNKSCLHAQIPIRTMREHIESSFRGKFGIQKLTSECLQSFYSSLKEYESQEAEFFVFDRIVSNILPEEFFALIYQIRQILNETYFHIFISQSQKLSLKEINLLFSKSVSGFIQSQHASAIIRLLYSENDAEFLCKVIENLNSKVSPQSSKLRRSKDTEGQEYSVIKYSVFEHIVIRYVTEKQLVYLSRITQYFKKFDPEDEGKITEENFQALVAHVSGVVKFEVDCDEIMVCLDPARTEVFCFSQIISYFSQLFVRLNDGSNEVCIIDLINQD